MLTRSSWLRCVAATAPRLLRARPASVCTAPGSNRTLDAKTLAKAREVFADYTFPHKIVLHNWRFFLKAGKAATGPPVGQEFAKLGLKAMDFAKSFNDRTKPVFKDDVELIVRIQVYFDKSYNYRIEPPPTAWFILRAVRKKRGDTGAVAIRSSYCALMTLEMCYEIAKIKGIRNFDVVETQPIETRVRRIVGQARRMGVAIIGVDTQADAPLGRQAVPDDHEAYMKDIRFFDVRPASDSAATAAATSKESAAKDPKNGGGKPATSNKNTAAAPSGSGGVALTRQQYLEVCDKYRAIHMMQFNKLCQDQLERAPLYERLQYAHRFAPSAAASSSSSSSSGAPPAFPSRTFSQTLLAPLSVPQLEEGLQDARVFNALWRLNRRSSPFHREASDRAMALRYLNTRGWFKDMTLEEMKLVFGGDDGGMMRRRRQEESETEEPLPNPFAMSRDDAR
eukprot:gene1931-1170_t